MSILFPSITLDFVPSVKASVSSRSFYGLCQELIVQVYTITRFTVCQTYKFAAPMASERPTVGIRLGSIGGLLNLNKVVFFIFGVYSKLRWAFVRGLSE